MENTYEIIIIFNKKEELFKKNLEEIKKYLEKIQAHIVSEDDMGIKELAYEVKNNRDGHYYLINFTVSSLKIIELNNMIRLNEEIIRHLVVKN
ncbi:MAG: 30S ribosomal protein S6 [Spirochaetes bacterium GWF1_41_5]|nr:MAG: 30S ribosomal protein S6 [Spirochaetes bacterium GWF1_41_5]HBE03426.1 30S ribosomal protein S6 [Spirochaetia bacterium]